jgi:NAD(P)-dependent dehydrogenase (short-subunit alcohol dehydrogenase family)
MIEQGRGGWIVNLAPQAGRRGEALVPAYCASKAAVINMTQSMALASAPHRITVNALAPGVVDTPFWEEVDRRFARLLDLPLGS